jgi:glucose-6-phosphate 1-dehydrogenase
MQDQMSFQFAAGLFGNHGKGYERLLRDVMIGDATLFPSAAFVEQGWKLVQPLLDAWQQPPAGAFPNYAGGSAGPEAADTLLASNGHEWQSLEQE